MERPKSIVAFEWSLWTSFSIGLAGGIIAWHDILEIYRSEPSMAALGLGSGFMIAMWLVSFAFMLLFWFMIARRRSNVTKWIYVVLMGAGILMTLLSLNGPTAPKGVLLIANLGSSGLTAFSIFCLFRADAVDWLKGTHKVSPDTFR